MEEDERLPDDRHAVERSVEKFLAEEDIRRAILGHKALTPRQKKSLMFVVNDLLGKYRDKVE